MTVTAVCLGAQQRFVGGDLSLLPLYEQAGDQWLDENGEVIRDLIDYVHGKGWNTVRVRLFVDPSKNDDPSTPQDLDYVTALAKRIKKAGMALMLDLHYSDTWADPSYQRIPAAWAKMSDAELATQLYTYTADVLQHLAKEGITPDFIQTGNEITYGLLWRTADGHYPASKTDYAAAGYCPTWSADYAEGKQQWERTAMMLKEATRAVREKAPAAKIIIHTELGALTTNSDHFYTHLRTAGFTDYDIIGLSYYPFWHGKMEALTPLMAQFKKDFPDKTVQIVETAWNNSYYPDDAKYSIEALGGKWQADAAGQVAYLKDLARTLHRSDNVNGIMYWAPEECGSGYSQKVLEHWYNRGMWKSSVGQKHSLLRAADGTSPIEALVLFLQDTINTGIHSAKAARGNTARKQLRGHHIEVLTDDAAYGTNGVQVR